MTAAVPEGGAVGLLDGMATCRSIRRYADRPVTDEELATILFHATRAPSGSNRQPFRFVVLRSGDEAAEARRLLGEAGRRMWAGKRRADGYEEGSGRDAGSAKARMAATMARYVDCFEEVPVVILPCLVRYREPTPFEGASIYPACQNLLLAARAIGLGGALSGFHLAVADQLSALLGLPDEATIAATVTLGHPAGRHGPVRRRPLAELVYGGRWGASPAWAVDPPGTRFTSAGPPD